MTEKLFTLIGGQQIHLAPQQTVIRGEDFSILMTAQQILQQVEEDAKNYRQKIAEEAEIIKENAFKEGYEAGYKEWAERLATLESSLQEIHQQISAKIIPIALKAAQKILGREIELNSETVLDIVLSSLKSVAQHKKIVIFVNKDDWETLEKNKSRIKDVFEDLQSLSIRPRKDIEPASCVIETEQGIVNNQMTHRWNILTQAFEKSSK